VLAAELDRDVEGLLIGQEPVLRGERFAPEPNLSRRTDVQVAHPVGVPPPAGADDGLACVRVKPQHHRHGLVPSASLASDVGELHERMAEKPTGVMPVGP
jgi:hypothetical protein